MNCQRFWELHWNQLIRSCRNQEGFILPSLVISVFIGSFVLLVLISIVMSGVVWVERLEDSISMMEDGRYTRRAIVSHIKWNRNEVTVVDSNKTVKISDNKRTTFQLMRRALYRRLTDGSLQPLSGSRIIGTKDKRKVDSVNPFLLQDNKALRLSWTVNNKYKKDTEFIQGYGGIANYEVSTTVSTHYDWYKEK